MINYAKKTIALFLCGLITGVSMTATAFAKIKNNIDSKNTDITSTIDNKSATICGKTFKYKDAPKKVKDKHDLNCKSAGVTPSPTDEIFIPSENFDTYGISAQAADEMYFVSSKDGYLYVSGSKYYSFNIKTTYVGYTYIRTGNPVHGLQILLNLYARKFGGTQIDTDSVFGAETYNTLRSFQSRVGLSVDGIAGPNTWVALINRALG
ncbi:peptidoglycan-binding domain-containing protein [Clostridium cylindrosporum]|uniref:Putative peptidoglycan binding domain protein n=1 Tax=Clostridium cylindrosporum DSM 605 TaxID=1121307 RepID=A0A0J8D957_CLOCY|nr:peptidoglycan-binding protein [Clostridium cylindrosporum]KMT22560.1 putative peptidoglycan binding domain protein [Clostridium cylindrosporum DSM 605]